MVKWYSHARRFLKTFGIERMSRKEVIDKTMGEIRTFLDAIMNGTSNYRSLHNLTEQVEHQYKGRFLIELVQNAHDALFAPGTVDKEQRIEIVLVENEHPHGALYIANDGLPFTPSNFKALSNLGQSDKDPQKSIGNKGIGFRSVLEVSKAPEIYSRKQKDSSGFDGYCFRFNPDFIQTLEAPIQQIIGGDNHVISPLDCEEPLLRWDASRYKDFRKQVHDLEKDFRARVHDLEDDWLKNELKCLSPYALPIPVHSDQATPTIKDFEKQGFSTVIRLPFLSDQKIEIAREKIAEMDESTVIFLQRLNKLRLVCCNEERCYYRAQNPRKADKTGGYKVTIDSWMHNDEVNNGDIPVRYWLWTRTMGGEKNPKEQDLIRAAVADLPGKWPDVKEATVAVAVRVGNMPEEGILNIYLPTDVPSGCNAHFSAPFYGDMSRTNIKFEEPFNELLLKTIAETSADVIFSSLAGNGEEEAATILDLLAPHDNEAGTLWWQMLVDVFSARGVDIKDQNIILSDGGWNSLSHARLLPEIASATVLKPAMLRSEATYPVFVQALREREAEIIRIFKKVDINPKAMPEDNAATIAAIASKLHESEERVDWSGFWRDVESLFGKDTKPLIGKSVLLGTDNQLHSCDDQCSVFFRPRSSGSDDEVLAEGGIEDIPETLRPFIAFLNKDIQTHIPRAKGGVETTAVHGYLSSTKLVKAYGVETIFSDILVKATPELPHDIAGPKSQQLCRDILQWGLKLLQASKHSMEQPIRLLSKLLAPCLGGWYPINKTSFGPGWPGKSGAELDDYLRRTATPECSAALKRLLLPPDHTLWVGMGVSSVDLLENTNRKIDSTPSDSGMGLRSVDLLEKAGVFNGIRLVPVRGKDWDARFTAADWKGVDLPEKGPAGYSPDIWNAYRKYIKNTESLYYVSEFIYEVQDVYALPGFEKLEGFDTATHELLMELLLASIPSWAMWWENWESAKIKKITGEQDWFFLISPLAFSLRETKWMQAKIDEETIRFRPSDRWHIPSPASMGGLHQFSHLMPMPASVLSGDPELTASMKDLGMPSYDPEEETADPRLLNDLAVALQDPTIDISDSRVFLGQVRTAWGQFYPDEENVFPDSVIVQSSSQSLKVVTPPKEGFVYLPDATAAVHDGLKLHSKRVVAMEPKDAKRLREYFQKAYDGKGIRLASELTTKALVDGVEWQVQDNTPQLSEELPWLIPVVLSIFAFSGEQSRGVSTKTFTKAIDVLRRVRIVWVDKLEAGLWHGEAEEARTCVPALWLQKDNTLLAISDARTEVSQLSETLASIVNRGDIDISLRLILENCESADEISDDVVCTSLRKLHITAGHYQEVQQRWLGDITWRVRLVKPLILLMQPEADIAPLDKVTLEEQFKKSLQMYDLSPLDLDKVLSIVRDATGLKSVGYKVWKVLGDQAQLDQWNKALLESSESVVSNDQANAQFQEHLDSVRTMLRAIIRRTMRDNPKLGGFTALDDRLLETDCPCEYAGKYWVVNFNHVMKIILDVLAEWGVEPSVVTAVEYASTKEELRDKLMGLGLELDIDPVSIQADNEKMFKEFLEKVQQIAIAWCLKENLDEGVWGQDYAVFETQLTEVFAKIAFVDIWDEAMCFKVLRKINQSQTYKRLWDVINAVSSVNKLMDILHISEEELGTANGQLEQRKQEQYIQKKTVNVCGKDFVNTEDNLPDLWDHICEAIEDDSVATVNLSDLEELNDQRVSKKRKKGNKKPTHKKKSKGRMSQSMKDIVGLAGEIHAFRTLQKSFGGEIVGPSSWISENSRHKYPENTTNDGYGCDFEIFKNGKIHYVEVKATQAEDETFELGSSEVELAIDSANRRKKEFVILHVLNARSDSPQFRLLPNPYDRKYKDKYKFEEAGLRVRYETT